MVAQRIGAIVLILVGIFVLAYGGFSYTKETHTADIGPLHMSVDERERVNMPLWTGIGAILIGGVLLAVRWKS